jgi:hypothetical protein
VVDRSASYVFQARAEPPREAAMRKSCLILLAVAALVVESAFAGTTDKDKRSGTPPASSL